MKKHSTDIRVRYAETDKMGVVYHSNYFIWFEVGRNEFFRENGISYRELEDMGIIFPVINCASDFLHPARYDDIVTITTWIEEIQGIRVRLAYTAEVGGTLLAKGETMHVFASDEGRLLRMGKEFPEVWAALIRLWKSTEE